MKKITIRFEDGSAAESVSVFAAMRQLPVDGVIILNKKTCEYILGALEAERDGAQDALVAKSEEIETAYREGFGDALAIEYSGADGTVDGAWAASNARALLAETESEKPAPAPSPYPTGTRYGLVQGKNIRALAVKDITCAKCGRRLLPRPAPDDLLASIPEPWMFCPKCGEPR